MPDIPLSVYSNRGNDILDAPALEMAGRSWRRVVRPARQELIRVPEGSRFFCLPHTAVQGRDLKTGKVKTCQRIGRKAARAVGAFLAPAYTRTLLPAYTPLKKYSYLPLWAYTAVGWRDDSFWVPAVRVDESIRWDPGQFDDRTLAPLVERRLKEYPDNRLLAHLAHCALEYHCFAAKNLFYRRWEMPLPTSPACNAGCLGCLSWQPDTACAASMHRITFVPTPEEIMEITIPHLEQAESAIASFGQGCEGEPIMQADTLVKAVAGMRKATGSGTLNLNTNGSRPAAIRRLCKAGLDSIRFSLNSTDPDLYDRYFKPRDYTFKDVLKSIAIARDAGLYISLNLFVFPGLTDREEEVAGLYRIIEKYGVNLVQLRNLNIDPELYTNALPDPKGGCLGIYRFIEGLKVDFPDVALGYFNKPKEEFGR